MFVWVSFSLSISFSFWIWRYWTRMVSNSRAFFKRHFCADFLFWNNLFFLCYSVSGTFYPSAILVPSSASLTLSLEPSSFESLSFLPSPTYLTSLRHLSYSMIFFMLEGPPSGSWTTSVSFRVLFWALGYWLSVWSGDALLPIPRCWCPSWLRD